MRSHRPRTPEQALRRRPAGSPLQERSKAICRASAMILKRKQCRVPCRRVRTAHMYCYYRPYAKQRFPTLPPPRRAARISRDIAILSVPQPARPARSRSLTCLAGSPPNILHNVSSLGQHRHDPVPMPDTSTGPTWITGMRMRRFFARKSGKIPPDERGSSRHDHTAVAQSMAGHSHGEPRTMCPPHRIG